MHTPAIPETMRVAVVEALTGPTALTVVDRPTPRPGPGEVLIKVGAAGINYADVMQTRGTYVGGPRAPYVPGLEAAGTIVALGEGAEASGRSVGERVLGVCGRSFAEYATMAAAGAMPIPPGWSDAQGAGFIVPWYTAHGCLRTVGHLKAGETVLIHAAAGGVGQAAIKIARHFGATVIGTVGSPEKAALARELGAHHVIDYTRQDFVAEVLALTGGRGADLVLEMIGGETYGKNLDATRKYGRIVVYGAASAEVASVTNVELIFRRPVAMIGYHIVQLIADRPDLFAEESAEIGSLIAAGVMVPSEPTAWPLARAAEALAALEGRQTTGKLVIVP
ncbi:MAG: NADPH:quinone oxidoreductase family protein [Nannocystaceae bacterium]